MTELKLLDKIVGSVWGKLLVLALQTALSSLVMLFIFTLRRSGDITLLKYAIVLGIGFIAGSSANSFLKGHTRTLKLLAATISAALSLMILYTLSGSFLGINLLSPLNSTTKPDWDGLMQFGLASVAAWLVIWAFRSPPWISPTRISNPLSRPSIKNRTPKLSQIADKTGKKKVQKSSRERSANKEPLSITKTKPRKSPAPLVVASAKKKSARKSAAKKLKKKPKKISRPKKLAVASSKSKTNKKNRPKTKRVKNKDITFTGVEEHVCPYCLDPVEPHDPRGVKICKICKTHHHKDCWGITGACQIPHSNN